MKILTFDVEDMDVAPLACQLAESEEQVKPDYYERYYVGLKKDVKGGGRYSLVCSCLGVERLADTVDVAPGFVESAYEEKDTESSSRLKEYAGKETGLNMIWLGSASHSAEVLG